MSRLVVSGPVQLNGHVSVHGAKNAALPLVIASAASSEKVTLHNVPTELNDIKVALEAIDHIGCQLKTSGDVVQVHTTDIKETFIPAEISSKIRSSLVLLGLLVGKCGHAKIAIPGGCNLGDRKFDLHLEGLRKLGANVTQTDSFIEVAADGLVGADIEFYLPTTTGTENIMLAACFAQGTTRIFNANTRPEIEDMANFLNAMGGAVNVKNRVVEIEGPATLRGCEYSVMPGWDEALTYIIGGALTGGEICINNFSLEHLRHDVAILRQAGVDVFEWGGNVFASAKNRQLRPFDLFTGPYPGVNSDMHPIFAALASQCHGESSITDQRFTERFAYVEQLQRLGVEIDNYGNSAIVRGPCKLRGNKVRALDLRCGAALLLSALKAEGITVIDNFYEIGRGYQDVAARLNSLGADVEEVDQ